MNTSITDDLPISGSNSRPSSRLATAAPATSKKIVIRFNIELSTSQLDSFFAATPLAKASQKTKADVLRTLLGGIKSGDLLKVVNLALKFPGDRSPGVPAS